MKALKAALIVTMARACRTGEVAISTTGAVARHGAGFYIYDREVDLSRYEYDSPVMLLLGTFKSSFVRGNNVINSMDNLRGLFRLFKWRDSNSFPVKEREGAEILMPRNLMLKLTVNDYKSLRVQGNDSNSALTTTLSLIVFTIGIITSILAAKLYSFFSALYAKVAERAISLCETRYYGLATAGKYLEAYDHLQFAVQLVRRLKGDAHVDVASFKHLLAKACNDLQLYSSAESLLGEVRVTYDLLGSHDDHTLHLLQDLHTALRGQGLTDKASIVCEEIEDIQDFMSHFGTFKQSRQHVRCVDDDIYNSHDGDAAYSSCSSSSGDVLATSPSSFNESGNGDEGTAAQETPIFLRATESLFKKDAFISPSSIADVW